MAYAVYSNGKYLGPLGPIFLVGQMEAAIERSNRTRKGRGKIPALTALFLHGETHEPKKAAKDISKLLTGGADLPENVVEGFQGLRQMLLRAKGEATISEA